MIVRVLWLSTAAVTAVLLDTVVLSPLTIGGVSPSVAVVAVLGVAFADGPAAGARYGFAVGLLIDLLSEGLMGVTALVLLLVGYGVGVARRYWSGAPLLGQMAAGSVGAAAVAVGQLLLALLFDQAEAGLAELAAELAASALFGLLLAPAVMPVMAKLSERYAGLRVAGGPRQR